MRRCRLLDLALFKCWYLGVHLACSVLVDVATHLDSSCQRCQTRPQVRLTIHRRWPVCVWDCLGSACGAITLDGGTDCLDVTADWQHHMTAAKSSASVPRCP